MSVTLLSAAMANTSACHQEFWVGEKIVKQSAALVWCAVLLFAPLYAQEADAPAGGGETAPQAERIPLNLDAGTASPAQTSGAPSSVFLFVRMVVVLALVVGCLYAVMRFFKRGVTSAFADDPFLKKTASLTLAPGKTVHVVTLDDSAFLVGVADNSVSLIGKIENKELVDAMNLYAAEEASRRGARRGAADFSRLLDIFTGARGKGVGGNSGGEKKSFFQTLDETTDVIRERRARIRAAEEGKQ